MAESSRWAHDGGRTAAAAGPPGDFNELLAIWTHFFRGLARTDDARPRYAVDAIGGGRSSAISRDMSARRSVSDLMQKSPTLRRPSPSYGRHGGFEPLVRVGDDELDPRETPPS